MSNRLVLAIVAGALPFTAIGFAQGRGGFTVHNPSNDNKPYDKHDLSGIWSRNSTPGGYGEGATCRDSGGRGFSNEARSGGRRGTLASQLAVQLSEAGGFSCRQILREVFCV